MTDPTIPPVDSPEYAYLKSIGALETPAPMPEASAACKQRLADIDKEQRRAELFEQLTGGLVLSTTLLGGGRL